MEDTTLATELLHEVKASSKRWFIAFIVVLVLLFGTIGVFVWYISLPVDEIDTVTMTTEGEGNANYVENSTVDGGINNGTNSKDNL